MRTLPSRGRCCTAAALCLAFLTVAAASGGENPAPTRRLPANAAIRFQGTSTLHDFTGTVPAQPFVLTLTSNTWSAQGGVVIGQMNTASEGRDRNMCKMFGTNDHPTLRGEVKPSPLPPAGTNVTLLFQVRNKTNALPVQISNWTEDAEAVRFHAGWDVSLKQYGLKPPSVMGVIRVGDLVHVEADVTASKTQPLTNAPAIHPPVSSQP